jgi:hypothetical protein
MDKDCLNYYREKIKGISEEILKFPPKYLERDKMWKSIHLNALNRILDG